MFREQLLVDPRFVMKSIEVGCGNHLHQVAVTGLVFRQEREVVGRVALVVRPIFHRARRHVRFAADDRFEPGVGRRLVKLDCAVEIAVVGNGDGRHSKFLCLFHQLLHPHRAVEKGVFGVKMKVNEGIGRHPIAL
jgi:hypothetical protein